MRVVMNESRLDDLALGQKANEFDVVKAAEAFLSGVDEDLGILLLRGADGQHWTARVVVELDPVCLEDEDIIGGLCQTCGAEVYSSFDLAPLSEHLGSHGIEVREGQVFDHFERLT